MTQFLLIFNSIFSVAIYILILRECLIYLSDNHRKYYNKITKALAVLSVYIIAADILFVFVKENIFQLYALIKTTGLIPVSIYLLIQTNKSLKK